MNVILGSGIVGLLAKAILGPSWKIIPFYRSRFFSFNPALDDNFIIRDERIDQFINDVAKEINIPVHIYQRVWSVSGELIKQFDKNLCHSWMYKLFGSDIPSQSGVYFDKLNLYIYGLRINQLYETLLANNIEELKTESAEGMVTEIGDHYLVRNGKRLDFDNAISTIPLDALFNLVGAQNRLRAKTIHYLHIKTDDLDFEGANQVLVTDQVFDFFKVTNIAPGRFLFYCHNDLPNPGLYLMQFMQNFDILDGTSVENAIPLGQIPKLEQLEKLGLYCVGSSAQWDWCMDVGSCILRLLKYSQRGNKPNEFKEFKL